MIDRTPYARLFFFFFLLLLGITGGIIQSVTNTYTVANRLVMSGYEKCWTLQTDQSDDPVTFFLNLRKDGSVESIDMSDSDKDRMPRDYAFKIAANQAQQAVFDCSPNKMLKLTEYKVWKKLSVTFKSGKPS